MTARIMVVDDTPLNVKLLLAKLQRDYYITSSAADGPEALSKVAAEKPDLILLDIMMPGMDGFEVCRRLKADPSTSHIPVVMVTALTDVADRVKGLEAGADDFLAKPIDDVPLMARVRALLRLKTLMDEWRLREKTSQQFSGHEGDKAPESLNIDDARVLLVEDNDADKTVIERTLTSKLAPTVVSASTGADALNKAQNGVYDVVMISLNLQQEDGLALVAQLRSAEVTRHTPIVMLSTDADINRVAKGLDLGANDYLMRPLDANEIVARVRTQIRQKRHYDRLHKNYEDSLSLALVDSLTGAFNRRYMESHLPKLLAQAQRSNKELTLLALDIDHFKTINDTHGHAAGDKVLKEVVGLLMRSIRPSDLMARIGGEEFVVLMPETDVGIAAHIADRLRAKIASHPIPLDGKAEPLNITISIGCAGTAGHTDNEAQLLHRADEALYKAKNQGRNQVVAAS